MDLKSTERTRVFVEVKSKGILGALEHHLVFVATPGPFVVRDVGEGEIEVAVEASIAVDDLEPFKAAPADREKMIESIRGPDVLDGAKWPTLTLRGRYRGTLDAGRLESDLVVRGTPRKIVFDVRGRMAEGDARRIDAWWEGTQSALGLKPYRALLGALQLRDWTKIRVEVEVAPL